MSRPDPVADGRAPALSAIVIAQNDEACIERTVHSVVTQDLAEPFEVIVVTSGNDRTAAIVRERFRAITLVELSRPALPGEARNAGLRVATGEYVSFPGSHIELPQGSLAARLRAHRLGYPMVTGAILNGTRTRAGWASYFLDHSTALPGRPSGELAGPPRSCSYRRSLLEEVGGFPEDMRNGEDTAVNMELARRGFRAYRDRDVALIHHSPCRRPSRLVRHHFGRGRGLGRILVEGFRHRGGLLLDRETVATTFVGYVPRRLSHIRTNVRRWGAEVFDVYRGTRPLLALGALAAWLGACYEILRPGRGKLRILLGRPGLTLMIAGLDGWPGESRVTGNTDLLMLARIDLVERRVRLVSLPRDLWLEIPGAGEDRINAAYNVGRSSNPEDRDAGPRKLRDTIEHALGIQVDDHAIVDFVGFRRIVDALGGIEVDVPYEIHDDHGPGFFARFDPGRQRLDGRRALDYARTRKAEHSDVRRRRRQLDMIVALYERVRRPRSPRDLVHLVWTARGCLQTSLGPARKLALIRAAFRVRPGDVELVQVAEPLVVPARTETGRWMTTGDLDAVGSMLRRSLGLVTLDGKRTPTTPPLPGRREPARGSAGAL